MSECTSTIASLPSKTTALWQSRKWCEVTATDPWWDYPTIYKSNDESVWTDQGLEQGNYFNIPIGFVLDRFLQGRTDLIARMNEAVSLLTTLVGELGMEDQADPPAVRILRGKITEMQGKANTAKSEINEVLGSGALSSRYGGRSTGPFNTGYFMTYTETADLKYAQSQIARAGRLLEEIYYGLISSSCNESGEGENCDRIAAALEALAAKDFGGNVSQALDKIAAAVGAEPLAAGVTVPRLVTEKDGGGTIKIRSIPEFIRWQFLQMDALIGRFPLKIKATDTEADEEGDQSREYIAGNLSDAIASLIGLAITNDTATDAILKGTMTACTEIASSRLIGIKSNAILESLEEWASYTVKEETIEVPFAFDVEGKTIDTALVSKKKKVGVSRWSGEGKNDFDIERIGKIVNTIYAICMTAFGHRFDPNNPEAQFKADLETMKNSTDAGDEDDFSAWADRVENEFSDAELSRHQGAAEVRPYGRPLNRRPRIKQIEGQGTEDIDGESGGDP